MNETLIWVLAWLSGGLLGAFFFGGLWWTVQRGLRAREPARWFLLSLALRMGVTLAGFYLVGGGDWLRLLLCLFGFITARLIVTRLTRNGTRPLSLSIRPGYAP